MSKRIQYITSILSRAWNDTWQWSLNTKLGFIISWLVGGMMGGLFVGESILGRILAGLAGSVIGIIGLGLIVFIVYLVITPTRVRNEARHKFIESNASYFSRIFGDPEKRKYLTVLDILESLVQIENDATDNFVGKYKMTLPELKALQTDFSKETNISTLPIEKAKQIIIKGEVSKQINKTIGGAKVIFPTEVVRVFTKYDQLTKSVVVPHFSGSGIDNALYLMNRVDRGAEGVKFVHYKLLASQITDTVPARYILPEEEV